MLAREGSGGAKRSHDFLRNSLLFADASQGALQGQTRPRRRLTNAFETSSFARSGRACGHAGHGVGWLGGLRAVPCMSSGGTGPPPRQPCGPAAPLHSSKGTCFRSAKHTRYEQAKGVSWSPSASTPTATTSCKTTSSRGVPVPAGTSLRSPSPPSPACAKGRVHFLPLFSILARPHPLAARPTAFPRGRSPLASQARPCRAQLRVLGGEPAPSPSCSQAPPSTLPRFPNLPSTTQCCGMPTGPQKGEGASLQLRGWAQGLLQELLDLNEVCFQLLVEQQEGWVGARR